MEVRFSSDRLDVRSLIMKFFLSCFHWTHGNSFTQCAAFSFSLSLSLSQRRLLETLVMAGEAGSSVCSAALQKDHNSSLQMPPKEDILQERSFLEW